MGATEQNTNHSPLGFDITEVHELVKAGKKIEAIKRVYDATGWGLKASKDYVDKIDEGIDLAGSGSVFYRSQQAGSTHTDLGPVKELLDKGRKLEAIKVLRDCSGMGLKEAHDFVEQLADGTAEVLLHKTPAFNGPEFKTTYSETTVNGKKVKPGDTEWEKVADLFNNLQNKNIGNGDALKKVLDAFLPDGTNESSIKNTASTYTVKTTDYMEPVWDGKSRAEKMDKNAFGYDKGAKGGSNIGLYIVIALIIAGIVGYLLKAVG